MCSRGFAGGADGKTDGAPYQTVKEDATASVITAVRTSDDENADEDVNKQE